MVVGGYFVRPGETPVIKINLRIDPPIFLFNSFSNCFLFEKNIKLIDVYLRTICFYT